MKRILYHSTLLLLFVFLIHSTASGQNIKGTVIVGGNLTQVEGDEIKGWSQFGFTGGLGAIVPFAGGKWGVNIETLFSQKGSYQKQQFEPDSVTKSSEYRLRLNYFEVPLFITFTDKDVVSFGLGGYYGRLVSAREEEHSGYVEPYIDTVKFNNSDAGFLLDIKVRIWKHLHINVRYTQSLMSIRERIFYPPPPSEPFSRNQFNQALILRFVYVFNEGQRSTAPPE